jgi:hypothetical protein
VKALGALDKTPLGLLRLEQLAQYYFIPLVDLAETVFVIQLLVLEESVKV